MLEKLRSQKGVIVIEMVATTMILLVFFFAFIGAFSIIQTNMYAKKIAREGAREASLTQSTTLGNDKAVDCATQYFGNTETTQIHLVENQEGGQTTSVTCFVQTTHTPLQNVSDWGVTLHAEAIYPWGN